MCVTVLIPQRMYCMQCCESSKADVHVHVRHDRLFVYVYVHVLSGGVAILLKTHKRNAMSLACKAIDPVTYVWPVH